METRHYITLEEEHAEKARAAQAEVLAAFPDFISQWSMDDMPACETGMHLLHEFSLAQPSSFALVKRFDFVGDDRRIAASQKWKAFLNHRNDCPDCNEADY